MAASLLSHIRTAIQPTQRRPSVVTQLQELNDFFDAEGLREQVNMLPPNSEWTFEATSGDEIKCDKVLGRRLYCGETPNHQTWAFVKPFISKGPRSKRRAATVVFWNVDLYGNWYKVRSLNRLVLMYPLRVFKDVTDATFEHSTRDLKNLIIYLYLENKHATRLFADDLERAEKHLAAALRRICSVYEAEGIDQIPDMHRPGTAFNARGQLTTTEAHDRSYNDDAGATWLDEANTEGQETVTVEPRPVASGRRELRSVGSVADARSVTPSASASGSEPSPSPTSLARMWAEELLANAQPVDENETDRNRVLRLRGIRQKLAYESDKSRQKEEERQALIAATDLKIKEEMNTILADLSKEEMLELLTQM
ncbi:hypothetical protein NX059_000867 [Plenodomus lindquistii]|nr:hypothetical protein NX059_000867 [Plenodomus lindquistii]